MRSAWAEWVTLDTLQQVMQFAQDHDVKFLMARVDVNHLDAVQKMEDAGFRLMDTLVYYAFKYAKKPVPEQDSPYTIRSATSADVSIVQQIAAESFKGYYGHYHADPRLDNAVCDAIYQDWAGKSVSSKDFADKVFVVADDGDILGFATLRMNSPQEGEGVLYGVAPHAQGRGIYRQMIVAGLGWAKEQGAARMVVSTQITNVAVQKVWARCGYEFDRAYYTLHKWF